MAMRDKPYITNHPVLPAIEQNGYTEEKELFVSVKYLVLSAPQAVIKPNAGINQGEREMQLFQELAPLYTSLCK